MGDMTYGIRHGKKATEAEMNQWRRLGEELAREWQSVRTSVRAQLSVDFCRTVESISSLSPRTPRAAAKGGGNG